MCSGFRSKAITYISTNAPLVLLITATNIFYGLSLFVNRRRLKPPVRILLGSLICFAFIYCGSLSVLYYCSVKDPKSIVALVSWLIGLYSLNSSMTCYVCLNFYYYLHIVPASKALFAQIKRNIGPIIYVTLIGNTMLYAVSGTFTVMDVISRRVKGLTHNNYTQTGNEGFFYSSRTWFFIIQLYLLVGVWIMMVSNFSMVHYLQRHMRSMARSGSRLTTPLYQSQMRVTITGILQGLLYFLFYTQYVRESLVYMFFVETVVSTQVSMTIATQKSHSLYSVTHWKSSKTCNFKKSIFDFDLISSSHCFQVYKVDVLEEVLHCKSSKSLLLNQGE
uniref:Taste receptor type 2 n=1 Tax=Salarias fasciatus TaxID=181472 RepID=A0A672H3C7_SALFA